MKSIVSPSFTLGEQTSGKLYVLILLSWVPSLSLICPLPLPSPPFSPPCHLALPHSPFLHLQSDSLSPCGAASSPGFCACQHIPAPPSPPPPAPPCFSVFCAFVFQIVGLSKLMNSFIFSISNAHRNYYISKWANTAVWPHLSLLRAVGAPLYNLGNAFEGSTV